MLFGIQTTLQVVTKCKGLSSHGKAILQLHKISKLRVINGRFLNIKISENVPVKKPRDRLQLTISLWIAIFGIY